MRIFSISTKLCLFLLLIFPAAGYSFEKQQPNSPVTFSDVSFNSYFIDEKYREMNEACDGDDQNYCLELMLKQKDHEIDLQQKIRLNLLIGLYHIKSDNYEDAKPYFLDIENSYPLLNDYIDYYLGEIEFKSNRWQTAIQYFRKIKESSRLWVQARFRLALSMAKTNHPQALAELETLLVQYPNHFRAMESRFELAELLKNSNPKRARELYLEVLKDRPKQGLGLLAESAIKNLKLKPLTRQQYSKIVIEEAKSLNRQFQYSTAQKILRADILAYPSELEKTAIVGELYYHLGRTMFKRRQYSASLIRFNRTIRSEASKHYKGLAHYMKMDAYLRKGDVESAQKIGNMFLTDFADHPKACNIRYMLARAYKESEQTENAVKMFSEITQLHPQCKYATSSLWYVGWLNYKNRQYEKAKIAFKTIATTEDSRFEKERALYWMAKIAHAQGFKKHSVDIYRLLVRSYPLSYYSSLAAQRLSELNVPLPVDYTNKQNLTGVPITVDLNVDISKYQDNTHFLKGIELLRLGKRSIAQREFNELSKKMSDDTNLDVILAYLYHLTDDIHRSIYLFRTRIDEFSEKYPGTDNRSGWLLAYPQPYKELVEYYCKQVGLDPLLLTAIMREESSFQEDVRSYAHAVGLTQIIYSTGKYIARRLGHPNFQLSHLTDPNISIQFGSFFLDELVDKFKGNKALAISSYNAGETAVNRWIRNHEGSPMDEFIEDIPYTQTRRYTRRVLKSYGIYRYLYTDDKKGFDLWRIPNEK